MLNKELRHLINTVWNSLKERKYSHSGWNAMMDSGKKTVMMTEEGKPLNKLRLVQNIWSHISRLSKSKLIDEMSSISKINLGGQGSDFFDEIPCQINTF